MVPIGEVNDTMIIFAFEVTVANTWTCIVGELHKPIICATSFPHRPLRNGCLSRYIRVTSATRGKLIRGSTTGRRVDCAKSEDIGRFITTHLQVMQTPA